MVVMMAVSGLPIEFGIEDTELNAGLIRKRSRAGFKTASVGLPFGEPKLGAWLVGSRAIRVGEEKKGRRWVNEM